MKRLLILALALMLWANCARHSTHQASNVGISQNASTRESPKPTLTNDIDNDAKEPEKKQDVPPEFSKIDFKNFSYPMSVDLEITADFRRRSVSLKEGSYEYDDRRGFGGARYELDNVDYVDLTGDGQKEAVVQLSQLICGGSCDGGSDFFYFYSIADGKPRLLSRLETGSAGYDCGLKSFILKKQVLWVETFRACRFNGVEFRPVNNDPNETGDKFLTNRFTRFVLRFNGNRFVLSQRTVFPCPEEDRRSYQPKIEISDE
ncbi:MAG: hypothetical protein QOF72_1819 [Blastocatellia bacterium]|jgi:hypothetical protein|nr:hypothetical protein [Blastocatellia bacterium]